MVLGGQEQEVIPRVFPWFLIVVDGMFDVTEMEDSNVRMCSQESLRRGNGIDRISMSKAGAFSWHFQCQPLDFPLSGINKVLSATRKKVKVR